MGDKWQIFLLQDKEEKPTAVLMPSDAREGVLSPVTEVRSATCSYHACMDVTQHLLCATNPLCRRVAGN